MAFYVLNWANVTDRRLQRLISKTIPVILSKVVCYQEPEEQFFPFTNVTEAASILSYRLSKFRHLTAVCGDNALCWCFHLVLPQKGRFTLGPWGLKWPNVFASQPDKSDLNMSKIYSTGLSRNINSSHTKQLLLWNLVESSLRRKTVVGEADTIS